MQWGWIDVRSVYGFPFFEDDVADFVGVEGAGFVVVDSLDAGLEDPSLEGVAAGVAPSDPDLSVLPEPSDPDDSVAAPSVDAGLAAPPDRLSVL
jgi:hypothetical protein